MSISKIATICGYVITIIAIFTKIRKPLKSTRNIANAQTCLLRSNITNIYYKHVDESIPTLREYERKNLDDLFNGYKALGGNHFVDDLYKEMREWHIKK